MESACWLKSVARLLTLTIVLTTPGTVCDARFTHSRSTSRRYLPLAGIFGFNGDRNKKNSSQQQQQQQQQYQNGQPPPRPPPRQSSGTTFVRPPPKGYPPPPPKQQERKQSSTQRQPPPPPPPPLPRVESMEKKIAKELVLSGKDANPDGNVQIRTANSTTSSTDTNSDGYVDKDESNESMVEKSKNMTAIENTVDVATADQGKGLVLEQPQKQEPHPPPVAQRKTQFPSQNYDEQAITWQDQRLQQQQYDQYHHDLLSQQHYAAEQQQQYDENLYYLQEELTQSLGRESALVSQLDNLTATALTMEQREELHKHQLDVLTERMVDEENRSADDRNLLLEYKSNCTALQNSIFTLQDDLEEWHERCNEWSQKYGDSEQKLSELREAIKEKVSEAEDLAIAMEELRMTEKRRQESTTKSNAKSGGLVSWVFGLTGFGKSSSKNSRYDEEVREDAFELAKSTLLRALQSERTNVHELESAVASLQQNNSAISEMVESRDNIIDELNNRIAVFEEDKVVLKAALRQLQKEMKEEEPKTQKLIDDLADAEQEIDRVKADFQSIIETHQDEVSSLQMVMSQKQKTITDAESNLTSIGTYVNKLEERLTSFAMTRRDMEDREKKCKEIEKKAKESETQRKSIEGKVEELKKQEEELKKLLEELAGARTELQKENRRLYTEQEFRIGEHEKLVSQYQTLQGESASIRKQLQEWKYKCERIVPDLEASEKCQLDLERQIESLTETQTKLNDLQSENAVVVETNEKLKDEIKAIAEEKSQMEAKLMNMSEELEKRKEAERLAKDHADKVEAEMRAKEEAQKRRPPHPLPSRPVQKTQKINDVPLRNLRKTLSKATGLHGVLTPSSSKKTVDNENTQYTGMAHPTGQGPPNPKSVQSSEFSEDSVN